MASAICHSDVDFLIILLTPQLGMTVKVTKRATLCNEIFVISTRFILSQATYNNKTLYYISNSSYSSYRCVKHAEVVLNETVMEGSSFQLHFST